MLRKRENNWTAEATTNSIQNKSVKSNRKTS